MIIVNWLKNIEFHTLLYLTNCKLILILSNKSQSTTTIQNLFHWRSKRDVLFFVNFINNQWIIISLSMHHFMFTSFFWIELFFFSIFVDKSINKWWIINEQNFSILWSWKFFLFRFSQYVSRWQIIEFLNFR